MTVEPKLLSTAPSDQNVLDLFKGEWSSRMPADLGVTVQPGHAALFEDDRLQWANAVLGPLDGLDVLELGPLEGAHATMLERFGAGSITAVEANPRAFLKCLCVKEIFGLQRTRFKLGSFVPYLETCAPVDLVVACGVLYHMTDPLRLLELICAKADRIFLWTHVFDPALVAERDDRALFSAPQALAGTPYRGVRRRYPEAAKSWRGFSGGADAHAMWLERDSLLAYLRDKGYALTINFEETHHVNGPALALCAQRRTTL
ncbi:class I SAM-dependent methyltransferase [Methylobacterium trifolii]|uniref:Class I SAM-dependent methyltransferase n=1 Tax=Methylobacterium trifolii TaxID=1003092 RepID=A0ABQ4TV07_9HYPH|nr:class I SAM-dependent methyltransferase [Methylobacterium trifolii]GJE58637.1 hypothetical protein MPOCJGCO_0719 [Methylobacterium trifolii]